MGIILLLLLMRLDLTQEWPSFRGPAAAGVADGQRLPDVWDGAKGIQIKWKTEIPGLAHSSPIVWGDRIFVTTAVSSRANCYVQAGLVRRRHRVGRSLRASVAGDFLGQEIRQDPVDKNGL